MVARIMPLRIQLSVPSCVSIAMIVLPLMAARSSTSATSLHDRASVRTKASGAGFPHEFRIRGRHEDTRRLDWPLKKFQEFLLLCLRIVGLRSHHLPLDPEIVPRAPQALRCRLPIRNFCIGGHQNVCLGCFVARGAAAGTQQRYRPGDQGYRKSSHDVHTTTSGLLSVNEYTSAGRGAQCFHPLQLSYNRASHASSSGASGDTTTIGSPVLGC